MAEPVLFEAIRKTAQKKRLASTVLLQGLQDLEQSGKAAGPEQIYGWLVGPDSPDKRAGRKLAQALVPPDRPPFGPYRPLTHLADGGMGSVWLAADPDDNLVVVKTLKGDFGQSEDLAYRFQREARITQQLNHDAAVRSLDAGQAADGTLYMILEYVDAGDLQELVDTIGALSERQSLSVLYQMMQVLGRAHELHLVHRDIKPANIFVGGDGHAKLADFGIARSTESTRTMLTMEGAIIGSPLYMSPEQVMGESDIDIRCDIYALGAVLYFCLVGEPPYSGSKVQEIMHMHCEAPVPDVRSRVPDISKATPAIIQRCMAKRRKDRYADPRPLLKDLGKALKKLGQRPEQPVPLPVEQVARPAEPAADPMGRTMATDAAAATVAEDLNADAAAETLATNLNENQMMETVATNLNAGPDAATVTWDPGATVAATALAGNPHEAPTMASDTAGVDATVAVAGFGAGEQTCQTQVEAVSGNNFLQAAEAGDWLCLRSPHAGDPTSLTLFARSSLTLGKLCDAPVDIGVRYYPVPTHKPAVIRVSRQHCRLSWDAAGQQFLVEDLGSANGTMMDGRTLSGDDPQALQWERPHLLLLAGVVSLSLRAFPARSLAPSAIAGLAPKSGVRQGMDSSATADALVITRPDNRSEMSYALVLRRVTIGGPGADLVVPDAGGGPDVEIGRWHDHWVYRSLDGGAWQPVQAGSQIACGGRMLLVESGCYDHFALEP